MSDPTEAHSVLSPSAAERWLACPASIRMERELVVLDSPPPESAYAAEGTAAHALAYLKASYELTRTLNALQFQAKLNQWRKGGWDEEEMLPHISGYVNFLRSRRDEMGAVLLLEQKVPTGVPSCWGTSDAVLVSPREVEIVDLKYGMGVRVDAEENPQLRLYGVGALEAFGDLVGEIEQVHLTVYQPRIRNIATETLTAAELRAWRDSVIPIAEQALGHDAPFGPSDAACRWCPASGQCLAQMKWATAMDFGVEPDVMSPEQLAACLQQIPAIQAWCAAVQDYALNRIYSEGKEVPGYKVVMSGGKRSISDPEGALEALTTIGWALDEISTRKIRGIGELERLLSGDFNALMGQFITKGKGSPSLALESDTRQSVNPNDEAVKEFS